jgi:hypothetical protein
MLGDEARRMAAGLGVQEIADVALLPKLHRLRLVGGHMRVAHPREEIAEHLRLGMGEFDELEAVGPGGVLVRDGRTRGVVGKRSHGKSSCQRAQSSPAAREFRAKEGELRT